MSNFTYEYRDKGDSHKRERLEWDNVWWEQTQDTETKRILYIGDSISCGTRMIATRVSGGEFLFDGFGTSKGLDNPYFMDGIRLFAKQQGDRAAIIFNNGLHGFHLDDVTEYPMWYEQMVKFLLEEFRGTPLVLVLTTIVKDEKTTERVKARNNAALRIAEKYGLPVIDLYAASADNIALRSTDGVHFTDEGYEKLAECIVNNLKEIVK